MADYSVAGWQRVRCTRVCVCGGEGVCERHTKLICHVDHVSAVITLVTLPTPQLQ